MKKHQSFRHITDSDRDRIQALRDSWHTQKEVATILGFSESALSRELNRDPTRVGRYVADRAREHAEEKRTHSKYPGMKVEARPDLKQHIIRELKKLRSPDEIAGRLKKEGAMPRIGTNAIYKWLYSDAGESYCRYLCTKRSRVRRQRHLKKRVLIPNRKPLKDRPDMPGLVHVERDLFVSPTRLHTKPAGLLLVAPTAQLLRGSILPNRESTTVISATQRHVRAMRADTCTADNGVENVRHEECDVPTYFCDPHAPWQKPHIENSIGLIRRWFLPKGTNLAEVRDDTFQSQLHLLNGKYRKSLGYKSAYEVALERGIITKIPRISLSKAVAFR